MTRWLVLLAVVVVAAAFGSASAFAGALAGDGGIGLYLTQAESYSACLAAAKTGSCVFSGGQDFGGRAECVAADPSRGRWSGYYLEKNSSGALTGRQSAWCTATTCLAGATPDGTTVHTYTGFSQSSGVHGRGGCCYAMHMVSAGKPAGGADSDGYTSGWWVGTGARCNDDGPIPGQALPVVPKMSPACKAGDASCWMPDKDKICMTTESGESVCTPRDPPPGGCINGATGSICVGKDGDPIPKPSDPPIPRDTTPKNSTTWNITTGGVTSNYTTNNYSGTSSGGTGPEGTSSSTNASNTSGSGNSGSNGTGSDGKCANGAVPTASGCSGTYRDLGCDTPPACFGDAVLCGIAANTHKSACNPASGSSVGGIPDDLKGDPTDGSGDPSASSVSSEVDLGDVGSGLDSGGMGIGRSCPLNDVSFTVMGKSVDVPFRDKCDYLDWVRVLVLAMAYFVAAKIISGVK